jgi:hypothetical protein
MPRRRNELQVVVIDYPPAPPPPTTRFVLHDTRPQNFFVADFLKNNTYDMMKELDKKEECSICMEDVLCCRKCFTLLSCGHKFHLSCIIKCPVCPICRNGQTEEA